MAVRVIPLKIEIDCAVSNRDRITFQDFNEWWCSVKVSESGAPAMIRLSRKDALAMIRAIEPWAKGEME